LPTFVLNPVLGFNQQMQQRSAHQFLLKWNLPFNYWFSTWPEKAKQVLLDFLLLIRFEKFIGHTFFNLLYHIANHSIQTISNYKLPMPPQKYLWEKHEHHKKNKQKKKNPTFSPSMLRPAIGGAQSQQSVCPSLFPCPVGGRRAVQIFKRGPFKSLLPMLGSCPLERLVFVLLPCTRGASIRRGCH